MLTLKKLNNLGLLGLIVILLFSSTAYADTDSINPFSSFDKAHNERLQEARNIPDQVSVQNNLSTEEFQSKENMALESSGNRYIIKFKDNSSMELIYNAINKYDYEILGKSHNRLFVLELNDIQYFQEQSSDIIEFVEKDLKEKINIESSDTYYPIQWALPTTKIPKAWEISKGSNSVYVAVIDSGIYRNQPDLLNTDIRNGWDYIFYDYCDWDSTTHGTNVTGIIGAETNNAKGIAGVNWNVAIIPLRVIYTDGSAYTSNTIAAIYDAADLKCDVINLSLGNSHYSSAENLAISYAISKGSIVVASAGNDGNNIYNYPASYNDVISVGSIDNKLKVSDFSQHNNKVDVIAPGENILTTSYWIHDRNGNDYSFVDGTSFSAPYVSGIAALMKAVKPSITAGEFMELLKTTSTDLGVPGYDNYYGYGLINAEKMLQNISNVPVKSITLNKISINLNTGASDTLKATISPTNATNHNITWKSSNLSVATVDNGIVRAISNGTSIITVTTQDGSKIESCTVKVETTTPTMDLDLYNPISKNRYSFYSFVDSPIIFDEVLTNFGNFLIAFNGSYYKVSEVQINLDSGAAHFEEAIQGLVPVEFDEISKIEVVKVNVININLNVGDKFLLPAKVIVEVEGKKETLEMEVEWDDLIDTTKVGDYTITGNLILPEGYINPKGIIALAKVNVKAKDGQITVDQVPYNIEILEPNSIGTIWMQATYKNNTNYPITSFNIKVLLKDKN